MFLRGLFKLVFILLPVFVVAQDEDTTYNEAYYESFSHLITARTYFSQKYTNLGMASGTSIRNLNYIPNTTLNFGVGATYEAFTLNLAYGFPFLNSNRDKKGETKYLDLQSHIYTRKMTIDVMGQFYKSFYLTPKGVAAPAGQDYYIRPDIKVRHFGVAPYYILNWKKLSLRAPMIQNEWQKKSAGSVLLGGDIYYGFAVGDSAFIPSSQAMNYSQKGIEKIRYFNIGPGAGYAYTYVWDERFYVTGAVTMNLPMMMHKEWTDMGTSKIVKFSPNLNYRVGIGYNDDRKSLGLMWVNSSVTSKGESGKYKILTGNVRLNIAYRLEPGPKLQKRLKFFRKND